MRATMSAMVTALERRFPYVGWPTFAFQHLFAFMLATTCWQASRLVRKYDVIEIPLLAPFFPLAPFFDPHDAMLNSDSIGVCGLVFWAALFPVAVFASRRRINPLVPALGIVLALSVGSIALALVVQ